MTDNRTVADRIISKLVSLGVSREEYIKILEHLDVNPDGRVGTVFPNPDDIEAAKSTCERGASETPTVARIVRSNTRLFVKLYLLLALVKNGKLFLHHKSFKLLLRRFSFKDGSNAKVAFTLAAISLSYKTTYKLLLELRPYLGGLISRLHKQEQKLPIPSQLWIDSHTFTPFIAGLVSGSWFKLFPRAAERDVIAIYVFVRTGEMLFNYLDDLGLLSVKPTIFGSWSLFPFAFSQLFHSFFFNPDANPAFASRVLTKLSEDFFPKRPLGYKESSPWPSHEQFVEAIAKTAEHNYPSFRSPLMFPGTEFPRYLDAVKPVVTRAHPAIDTMTGAIMHPFEPSLFRTLMEISLKKYGHIGKYVFALYLIQGFVLDKKHKKNTSKLKIFLQAVAKSVRTTTFIVMTIVSAYAGIEFAQSFYSKSLLSKHRFKFIAFMAGLWAFIDQAGGRGRYIFAARAAILSYWRVLVKDKRVRTTRSTDVYLFATSFAVMMTLFDRSPASVSGALVRKVLSWVRNDEFSDPVKVDV